MMENLQGTLETNVSFERVKQELNKYLIDYLKERSNTPKEAEKKTAFMREFNNFSNEHRRQFRDYLSKILQNDPSIINDIDDDLEQITGLFETMKRIDQLEVYAGVCNNCNTPQTQPLGANVYGELENPYSESKEHLKESEYSFISGKLKSGGQIFYLNNLENIVDLGNNRFKIKNEFSSELGFERGDEKIINIILSPDGEHIIKDNNNRDMTIIPNRRTIKLFGFKNSDVKENRINQGNIPDKEHHITYVKYFTHRGDLVTLKFSKKKGNVQYNVYEN